MPARLPSFLPGRLFRTQNLAPLSPLNRTLACHLASIHSKGLNKNLTPLFSTLTKNRGRGPSSSPSLPSTQLRVPSSHSRGSRSLFSPFLRPRRGRKSPARLSAFRLAILGARLPHRPPARSGCLNAPPLRSFTFFTSSTSFTSLPSPTKECLYLLSPQELPHSFRHNRGYTPRPSRLPSLVQPNRTYPSHFLHLPHSSFSTPGYPSTPPTLLKLFFNVPTFHRSNVPTSVPAARSCRCSNFNFQVAFCGSTLSRNGGCHAESKSQ